MIHLEVHITSIGLNFLLRQIYMLHLKRLLQKYISRYFKRDLTLEEGIIKEILNFMYEKTT